jgi:long-chain acyl-CoA synthetase
LSGAKTIKIEIQFSMQEAFIKIRETLGVAETIDCSQYKNLVDLFEQSAIRYADQPAMTSIGHTLMYQELDQLSAQFAAYLQHHTDLQPGDRVALQLPNLIQYPVVLFGVLRAGMMVVNTNPLYTERELKHQLKDSGAKAMVVLANVVQTVKNILPETNLEQLIVTELADLHPLPKRLVVNTAAKYIKRMVPEYDDIDIVIHLNEALQLGGEQAFQPIAAELDDIAVLQYTGGTTGVAKGAMLTHGNLLANVLQGMPIFDTYEMDEGGENCIMPLPLYHIYTFTVCMIMMVRGSHIILIPDPRQFKALIRAMRDYKMTSFNGINPLFISLCQHPEFKKLDFSALKMTLSGGMALTSYAAELWEQTTGKPIYQGYGLTETSPIVAINPGSGNRIGTIGIPVSSTEVKLIDQSEPGGAGELCVRGPQVMKGYWQRPEATAEAIDAEGWFCTGDIAEFSDDGYIKIVDRKKDMIIVSGFNVYPNEIEDVVSQHPDVMECAAIGLPHEKSGEVIKLFVVSSNSDLTAEALKAYCKKSLTGYKVPSNYEFCDELPKSNVGKVLRRKLRERELEQSKS